MSKWQIACLIWDWLEAHTTRIIGTALGTVTVLVGTGIIPNNQLKFYTAAIAILTYWRGQSITNTVATAKAIVGVQRAADLKPPGDPAQPGASK